jgi:exopolysaccharide biosynthesis polyprenyl glycosylphosphotransferase
MAVATHVFERLGTDRPELTVTEPAVLPVPPRTRARRAVPAFLLLGDVTALLVALAIGGGITYPLGLAYVAAVWATIAATDGYRSRITLSALHDTPWLITRLAIPLIVIAPIALIGGAVPSAWFVPLAIVFVIGGRALSYAAVRWQRHRGHMLEGTVILGAGGVGVELARVFQEHTEYGVRPVGFLDQVSDDLPLPLLGDVDALGPLLERGGIHRVIVAFGPAREADLVNVLRTAAQHDVELHVVPRFFDVGGTTGTDSDDVRGIPLQRVRRAALRAKAEAFKRAVDVLIAGTLLLLAAPAMLVIAVLVKTTSRGPVFFSQERVGCQSRIFRMHKFRTMIENAEEDLDRLRHLNERDGLVFKIRDDPRCTPVGRWLRRFSLDELPQLWHVLIGDMSLVGPRPAIPSEVSRYDQDARWRLLVKPGLTGLWQVSGRSDLPWSESLRLDLYYIYNWTPGLDLSVLGRTFSAVLRRDGAY